MPTLMEKVSRKMNERRVSLDDVVNATGPIALVHSEQLAGGMLVANAFVDLHFSAAGRLHAAGINNRSDTALLLLSAHVFNLYSTTLELALEGRFDIAWHLSRAMFDAQGLAFAVAADEEEAAKFLRADLKASAARKFAIRYMNASGYEDIAPIFEDRWTRNATAANSLAHVNVRHALMVMTTDEGRVTPHYGGRQDPQACRLLFALAHEEEMLFLSWIEKFRMAALGEEWRAEAARGKSAYMEFREDRRTVALLGDPKYALWAKTLEERKRQLT